MLEENATIAVIAPSGIPNMESLEMGMSLLKKWGIDIVEGRYLRKRHRYNAGTIEQRSSDLNWALSDKNVNAVWLARGGYGCSHCLPYLQNDLPTDRIIIGFSDATSLFGTLRKRGFKNLIHGPVLETLATDIDKETKESIYSLLFGLTRMDIKGHHLCGPMNSINGPLVGGNLSVLASIAGTAGAISARGAIVLLEDVNELAYRIDRTVTQLIASGFFDGALGIVLGEFVRCSLPENASFSLDDLFVDLFNPLDIPVASGLGVGHGKKNLSWIFGERVSFSNGSIYF
ncbi:MAG TPA: LD-carboxypeptidase [Herbaspirillum sp.]|jgi:muramoyltetrapeptide carboxypeptidase